MSAGTTIEWTEASWNPVTGCTKVSPGCDHCYAERLTNRFHGKGAFDTVRLDEGKMMLPFTWRQPRRVFVNSVSDLFHDDVPDWFIFKVWNVMAQCPQHTFQILTKRHARMRAWVTRWADTTGDSEVQTKHGLPPMPRGPEAVRATYTSGRAHLFADMLDAMGTPPPGAAYPLYDWAEGQRWWPRVLRNVWLGVSAEDQHWLDIRGEALRQTPAAVRWLSCEPLLGPVDLTKFLHYRPIREGLRTAPMPPSAAEACGLPALHWVVAGGESGPDARPMHPDWARSLRDQCGEAGIPFFFKQWGESLPLIGHREHLDLPPAKGNRDWSRPFGDDVTMCKVGKKKAGRKLDGRTWDEYPAGAR